MTTTDKINKLFIGLTARLGVYPLKDGQSLEAIKRSWERSLGEFSMSDLTELCATWCDTTKKPFWPEPGDIRELADKGYYKPERNGDRRPERIKIAERDFASWWAHTVDSFPKSIGDVPVSAFEAEQALAWMIAKPGKSFLWAGTDAWLDGILPNRFEDLLADWLARRAKGAADYQSRKLAEGTFRANTAAPDRGLWAR
jgi:hypothetical protein